MNIYLSDNDKKLILEALYNKLELATGEEIYKIKDLYNLLNNAKTIHLRG